MADGDSEPERLAVIGAGTMGTGIAALAAGHGLPVHLVDVDGTALARALERIPRTIRHARLLGALPKGIATGPLSGSQSMDTDEVAAATVVIEAVPERAGLKATVLAAAAAAAPEALLLTITSGVPVDELADAVPRPDRLAGAHFMNPAHLAEAVEVVHGPRTGAEAAAHLDRLLAALGRTGLVVGDGPGFVVNRILQRMINEAARIVAEGRADAETVDAVFTRCLGHRTGPLATADLIGLDNVVDSLRELHARTSDPGYEPCDLLTGKVAAGELGHKSGQGFFSHREAS